MSSVPCPHSLLASPTFDLTTNYPDRVDIDIGMDGKFSSNPWTPSMLGKIVAKWQSCMYEANGWNALFLENHDQSRSVSRFTPHRPENRCAAAKMLAAFIGLQTGTLFVYQGQELGMANLPRTWPIEEYKDIETQNLYRLYVSSSLSHSVVFFLTHRAVHCSSLPRMKLVWPVFSTAFT